MKIDLPGDDPDTPTVETDGGQSSFGFDTTSQPSTDTSLLNRLPARHVFLLGTLVGLSTGLLPTAYLLFL